MPGSDPVTDLGSEWISRIADSVRTASQAGCPARPIVVLERLAALFPVAGPRDVMQSLWDKPNSFDSPISHSYTRVLAEFPGVLVLGKA